MIFQYPDGPDGGVMLVVDPFMEVYLRVSVSLGSDGRLHLFLEQLKHIPNPYLRDCWDRTQRLIDVARSKYHLFEDCRVAVVQVHDASTPTPVGAEA